MTALETNQITQPKEQADMKPLISRLLPATQVFIQIVRLCAHQLVSHKRIDLAVPSSILLKVLDLSAGPSSQLD